MSEGIRTGPRPSGGWRRSPAESAFSLPYLNAIYIPGLQPTVGQNLWSMLASSGGARSERVLRVEWYLHEWLHVSLVSTPMARWLCSLVWSLWLLLDNLDQRRLLRIPSWRIDGCPELTEVVRKAVSTLGYLEGKARVVDEVICTAFSVASGTMALSIAEKLTDENRRKLCEGLKQGLEQKVFKNYLRK